MRLTVEVVREPGGQLHGRVSAPDGSEDTFAGVLDLLRILEGHDLSPRPAPPAQPDGPAPTGQVHQP